MSGHNMSGPVSPNNLAFDSSQQYSRTTSERTHSHKNSNEEWHTIGGDSVPPQPVTGHIPPFFRLFGPSLGNRGLGIIINGQKASCAGTIKLQDQWRAGLM